MHFVSGGAYNGKANWVKEYYHIENLPKEKVEWISAYEREPLSEDISFGCKKLIVIEGLERWILQIAKTMEIDEGKQYLQSLINRLLAFEQSGDSQIVIIGTDISKGIVPVERDLRKWRDLTGFLYQYIVDKSEKVHRIWFGIAQPLK